MGEETAGAAARTWTGKEWSIEVADGVTVTTPVDRMAVAAEQASELSLRRRWLRWGLYRGAERIAHLRGISTADRLDLAAAIRKLSLRSELAAASAWTSDVDALVDWASNGRRWITTEAVDALVATRPPQGLGQRVDAAGCAGALTDAEQRAVLGVDCDLLEEIADVNRRFVEAELASERAFFDTIEKTPLTDEQATAVACFDNRVLVLAAAGSGKTSVMVARAAYAVHRCLVAPDRVLLLAFNKAAATELQQRVTERFAAAGIDSTGVTAATFHSFGLDVIGAATGRKPRPASWLTDDVAEVLRIVDALSDASPSFRYDWDLYRLLFSQGPTELDDSDVDAWDPDSKTAGFRTFAGEVVKSHGERLIADFLYLSGVNYRYEQPYSVDVADARYSQYRPDFYYPDIDVWHEHWALDRDGNPPAEFSGYASDMAWKRQLHASHGTTLIETTWDGVLNGDDLARLRSELEDRRVVFDWNPDRPTNKWTRPADHQTMARLVRSFMAHVKSNSMTADSINERLAREPRRDGFRTRLFLRIYSQIHAEWDRRLAADDSVDFDDMLVTAAGLVEGGFDPGYDLVLVDEFQDASQARARLTRALVAPPGRYLLAVGDDWQAINRFAGADLSVMTRFSDWFGRSQQVALTTTFRCPQTACDTAAAFVSKNPIQFSKPMRSAQSGPGAQVRVVLDDDPRRAVAGTLRRIAAEAADGSTVDVLGRYGFQRDLLGAAPPNLAVRFRTVHSSKGLEADHIVIVGMETGRYGFPSRIADDPVLELAMPIAEQFPHAEERRLFYVALTRARHTVAIITPPARMSPFVTELLNDPNVTTETIDGSPATPPVVCTSCRRGTMVPRRGPYGPFLGCSTWPACTNKAKAARTP
jgi:DNA helicase-4